MAFLQARDLGLEGIDEPLMCMGKRCLRIALTWEYKK
jgi:hypothetical protein